MQRPIVPPPPENADRDALVHYGQECALVGIFNERAAVMIELDYLAREFDTAGKPNTARRVRETAAKIDARDRDGWR